jgi:predicted type IV restriction endonuclease
MIEFEYSRILGCVGWKIERPKEVQVNPKERKKRKNEKQR